MLKRPLKAVDVGNRWGLVDKSHRPIAIPARRKRDVEEIANAVNVYPATERLAQAAGRIAVFLTFVEAGAALDGEEVADDTVVTSYMGHGASDALRWGDFRELRAALMDYAKHVPVDDDADDDTESSP